MGDRSSHQRYSVRKGVLKNFAKFKGKPTVPSLFFSLFSCEFWEISKNTYFTEHLWVTPSGEIPLMKVEN